MDLDNDHDVSCQAMIHNHESKGEFREAAQLLIDFRFFRVSRGAGLLARLPYNMDGAEALRLATKMSWSPHRDQFRRWSDRASVEKAAGLHYLTHHAPDHDKVYVRHTTLDHYSSLGGGLYPGFGVELSKRKTRPEACVICGQPVCWPSTEYCEACFHTISRLPRLLERTAGLEIVLRAIGELGLYELAIILQGREQANGNGPPQSVDGTGE